MSVLEKLRDAARAVAAQAGPAVVGIRAGRGAGSGVVVAEGKIVTNAHNLTADEVVVTFADGRTATGRALGVDVDGDLAVVEVDTGASPTATWSAHDGIEAGEPVFALANPAGGGVHVSFGLVSAAGQSFRGPRGRRIAGSFEHTAPLPRGASGGPVVDGAGRVIGINTHRLGEGLYLAVPAGAGLTERIEALGRGESPRRHSLGVGLIPSRAARQLRRAVGLPDRDGLLVRAVEEASPAVRAGIRAGDLIVGASGRPVTKADDLHAVLDAGDPALVLSVVRGVEELEVTVDFGDGAT